MVSKDGHLGGSAMKKIAPVVETYDRLELLKRCIEKLRGQGMPCQIVPGFILKDMYSGQFFRSKVRFCGGK